MRSLVKTYGREILLVVMAAGSLVAVMALDPIPQNLAYHNFADTRPLFGVPNFFNVLSNLLFLLVGFPGILFCIRDRQTGSPWSWIVFFVAVTSVSFGSGYYHLAPDNGTLVWDRLPMAVAFMGLFVGLLGEYVKPGVERVVLLPFVLLGIGSVVHWHFLDDLRFYGWIQFFPLLCLPVMVVVFKSPFTHQRFYVYALGFYALAKLAEVYDEAVFSTTLGHLSGHSLKHLLAAVAPFFILLMFRKRKKIRDLKL